MSTNKIQKYPPISKQLKVELTKFENEAIEAVAESQGISKDYAKELLTNDVKFNEIISIKDKQIRLEMMEKVLPRIIEATQRKVESGSMEQAKHAITAWSIGKDKAMGTDKYSGGQTLNIAGKQVQINLGFKFKPFKSKTP